MSHTPAFVSESFRGIAVDIFDRLNKNVFMDRLTTALKEPSTFDGEKQSGYGVFLIHPHEELVARSTGLVLQHLSDRHALFFSSVAEELDFYPMGGLVTNIVFLHEEFLRARWMQILTRLMIKGDSLKAALSNSCRESWQ